MNKLMTIIFASVFICLSFYTPVGAGGWGNTNWGMSISEVEIATRGKVILNENGKKYSHKLQDNVSIGEHNFEVNFHFTDNKLDTVHLSLITTPDTHYGVYLNLLDKLKRKYGSPSDGPNKDKVSPLSDTEWMTKDMVIKLFCFSLVSRDKTNYIMGIHYSPRQSASPDNL